MISVELGVSPTILVGVLQYSRNGSNDALFVKLVYDTYFMMILCNDFGGIAERAIVQQSKVCGYIILWD